MTDKTENDLNNLQKNDTPLDELTDNQSDEKKPLLLSESSKSKKLKSTQKKTIKKPYQKQLKTPKIIPRHCLEKKDWINLLATPSRKYSPCSSLAINTIFYYELSQPTRYKIITKLQNRTAVVPVPFVDELMHILVDDHLSLEEVEELFQNISKKKKTQRVQKTKCQNVMKPVQHNESLKMSKDTIICQYNIAEAFVKSILHHKNVVLRKDLDDLVKVIEKRLTKTVSNNEQLDKDGKVYQQILFSSKLVANWIAGVLEEVAEQNEEELKRDCDERRKRMEADVYNESDDVSEDGYDNILIDSEKTIDDGQEKTESNDNREKFSDDGNNEQSTDELMSQDETETNVHDFDKSITNNTTDNKNDEKDDEKVNEKDNKDDSN